jgi:hypothetical protein
VSRSWNGNETFMAENDVEREDDEREGPSVLSEREAMSLISSEPETSEEDEEEHSPKPELPD